MCSGLQIEYKYAASSSRDNNTERKRGERMVEKKTIQQKKYKVSYLRKCLKERGYGYSVLHHSRLYFFHRSPNHRISLSKLREKYNQINR
jgi:hypothetical protein